MVFNWDSRTESLRLFFCLRVYIKVVDDNRIDSISGLPNEIICHIVSFLSAKEAAFTSVLSKRWLNLFAIIPNLKFNGMVEKPGSFVGFMDRLLALPASSRVRKFNLVQVVEPADYAHVNLCICNVLKRGVLDLDLLIMARLDAKKPIYPLPFEVFTCKTVVVLKLGDVFVIDVLPEDALLPALKNLFLDSVRFYDLCGCAFQKLLSSCPVLEDLVINGVEWENWKWSRTVSSPTLQRLTINRTNHYGFDGSYLGSITFDTPNLVYLEYIDYVPDGYPIVNLGSLVEAMLDLTITVDHMTRDISSNPTNLFKGLKNVQILTILSTQTFEAFYCFREAIPVFENLRRLSITPKENDDGYCMRSLPFLLTKSPNLEILVMECLHYDCECMLGYSCLLFCPVKVLEITKYKGTKGELEQMKHFLGKLSCLELVKLRIGVRRNKEKLAMDLLMFTRASVNCKIELS